MAGNLGGRAPTAYPLKRGATLPSLVGYIRSFRFDSDDGAGSAVLEGTAGRCTPRLK